MRPSSAPESGGVHPSSLVYIWAQCLLRVENERRNGTFLVLKSSTETERFRWLMSSTPFLIMKQNQSK